MTHQAVDLSQVGVVLRLGSSSTFVRADFSTADRGSDGVICWNPPGQGGLFGGLVIQDTAGEHGGERHLEGEELLVVLDGALHLVLLDDAGKVCEEIRLVKNQAFLVPRNAWHRVIPQAQTRYFFMGGGRTEIRPGSHGERDDGSDRS